MSTHKARRIERARRDAEKTGIRIDIACNDADNGSFASRCLMFHLPSFPAEFESRDFVGPRMRELPGCIRVSRRAFPIKASKEWIGNWCWNAYWMAPDVAARFVIEMHRIGRFQCVSETQVDGDFYFRDWDSTWSMDAHAVEWLLIKAEAEKHG